MHGRLIGMFTKQLSVRCVFVYDQNCSSIMVQASAALIKKAQALFAPYLRGYPQNLANAILVEHFKQGDSYYKRFIRVHAANQNQKVCPGDGGCRFLYNLSQIQSALTCRAGVVRTGPRTATIVPDIGAHERATRSR